MVKPTSTGDISVVGRSGFVTLATRRCSSPSTDQMRTTKPRTDGRTALPPPRTRVTDPPTLTRSGGGSPPSPPAAPRPRCARRPGQRPASGGRLLRLSHREEIAELTKLAQFGLKLLDSGSRVVRHRDTPRPCTPVRRPHTDPGPRTATLSRDVTLASRRLRHAPSQRMPDPRYKRYDAGHRKARPVRTAGAGQPP